MTNLFAENKEFIRKFIPSEICDNDPILVDITNIAYYTQLQSQDEFNVNDFVLNLPWDVAWFEYKLPNKVMKNGKIQKNQNPHGSIIGVLAMYDEATERISYQVFQSADVFHKPFSFNGWEEPEGIRWLGGRDIKIDKSDYGRIIIGPFLKKGILHKTISELDAKNVVNNELTNVFYATTFCHCRNVEYYEKEAPEKLQKANIKRGKKPQETYKILDIGGLQKQAKSESNSERGELKTALHICRGHFKTYTEENPLFGKHTGTYWWPMHKRGSEDNGKVNKDYKINTN